MKTVYVLTLKTQNWTTVRVFTNPAKAIREATITRNSIKASWVEIKDGHVTTDKTTKVTVKPVTVE